MLRSRRLAADRDNQTCIYRFDFSTTKSIDRKVAAYKTCVQDTIRQNHVVDQLDVCSTSVSTYGYIDYQGIATRDNVDTLNPILAADKTVPVNIRCRTLPRLLRRVTFGNPSSRVITPSSSVSRVL